MEIRQSRKMCSSVKKDGEQCQARPINGSDYCFFHDPATAAIRRKSNSKGGKNGKLASLSTETPDVRIKSSKDLVWLLEETISQVRRGDIEPRIANAVGYLSGIILRAREQGVLEERMKRIEIAINDYKGKERLWYQRKDSAGLRTF